MRAALTWARRVVLGVLALGVLAVLAVVLVLHTGWGREIVRRRAEAALADSFPAGARIGRLEGSPFGELVVHDLELDGPDHRPALVVGTARIDLALAPLVHHHVEIERLVLEDVALTAPIAPAPRPAERSSEPSAWSVDVAELELHRARLVRGAVELRDVELTGTLHVAGGAVAAVVSARGTWRGHALAAVADVQYADGVTSVPFASLAAERARASAIGLRVGGDALAGAVTARVPVDAARALAGVELPGELAVSLAAHDGGAVELHGMLGATRLAAWLRAELAAPRARGLVTADDPVHGFVALAVDATADRARGIASWRAPADAAPAAAAVAFDTAAGGGWVAATGAIDHLAAGDELAVAVRGTLDAELTRADGVVRLAHARLVVDGRGLAGIRGAAAAHLEATGRVWPAPALHVTGTLAGRDVAHGGYGARAIRVALDDLAIDEAGATGAARLEVTGARRAGARLGSGRLAARLTRAAGGGLALALGAHRVVTAAGAVWTGDGGRLEVAPDRIELTGFSTASAAGRIGASGHLDRATGDLAARLAVHRVALGALAPGLRGTLDATVAAARTGGRWSGALHFTGSGVALSPALPALDAAGELTLRGRRVRASATATGAAGRGELALVLDGPRDVTDVAAWRGLGRGAIRSARLALANVDASRFGGSGTIDGELALTADGAGGALHVRGVHTRAGELAADLALARDAADVLSAKLDARVAGLGRAAATLAVALPARPFDPAAWDRGALRGAHVEVGDIAFDPGVLRRLGVTAPYRGRVGLVAEVAPGATHATLRAHLAGLQGGAIARPLALDARATLDGAGLHGGVTLRDGARILVEGAERAPLDLDHLDALAATPLTATIAFPAVPARALLAAFGRTDVTGGTLAGTIDIAGTLGRPTARATFTARDLAVPAAVAGRPAAKLTELAVTARWDGAAAELALTGHEASGGTLSISASGRPRDPRSIVAKIDAKRFDLAPLAAFAPGPLVAASGTLDGALSLHGLDLRQGELSGELHLRDGRVPLTARLGTLRRADADVAIEGHRLTARLEGRLGAGRVHGTATIGFDGAVPRRADVELAVEKLAPIASVEPQITAQVTAHLARTDRWTGTITVRHGTVVVPSTEGNDLLDTGAPDDMTFVDGETRVAAGGGAGPRPAPHRPVRPAPTHPWLVATVDVHPTSVQTEEARLVIAGKVTLSLGDDSIGLDGTIATLRGDAELFGRRYQVDHAAAIFDGTIDPRLDARLTHDFDDLTLIAEVAGRGSDPQLRLSSDPATYSQGQLLGFLLGGEPGGDPASTSRDAAAGVGASIISSAVGKRLEKVLPLKLDVLSYQTATATSSSSIRAGKWLSRRLFVAYRAHPEARADENANEGEVEYYLPKNWMLQGAGGDRGIFGLDLLHRWRW